VAALHQPNINGDLTMTPARKDPSAESAEAKRKSPRPTRRRYVNSEYPIVVLRFEDGHEIRVERGTGKSFEGYEGERVRIIAIYDPTSTERVLIATWRTEQFEPAP
jgi:hypothetical protein